MVASDRFLRWLCWALVGFVLISGVAVPIWAILLARGARMPPYREAGAA